ncbi:MAG: hypothetical protein ACK52I_11910 [Pseudomonadota bacterium]
MAEQLEHFVYGTVARLKRFRAALPAGIEVRPTAGGIILRETAGSRLDIAKAVARIETLAVAHGLEYDGHGRDTEETDAGAGLDIQTQAFGDRTGVRAGHGFALPLPNGRFGHAVYRGGSRQGFLLVDVSVLVTDRPARPDALREAPRRYRQPILVWHTRFAALPLPSTVQLAQLPCEVVFRSGVGWPDPEAIAQLERRFAVSETDTPEGWEALLMAMARTGERLPGIDGYTLSTARVGRTGALKLIEDHTLLRFADDARWPMPWQPSGMDEVIASLVGGADMVATRDKVT